MAKKLSIIIPIFNEEDNILYLYNRISKITKDLKIFTDYEIIIIDDGSRDKSPEILKDLSVDPHLKIISLTRNFGQDAAITAGTNYATGDAAVILDADLQDPPELMVQFEQELNNGYEIAYGQRTKRLNETFLKKATSTFFCSVFRWLTGIDMPENAGNFCMMSRRAIDAFNRLNERSIFVRGMIFWSGLSKTAVPFVRQKRNSGETKYNYWKLTKFAIDNIISFSTSPLYFIVFGSLFTIFACIAGTIVTLFIKFSGLAAMTGWTSIIITMLFLSSVTLFCLGLIGLYIGKIFEEIKKRPRYIIDKFVNFDITHAQKQRSDQTIIQR